LAAQRLGCQAVIVMPVTTPQIKINAVAARGAEVVLAGDSYDEAYKAALALEKKRRLSFVHPYDDPEVIAGQGTIGMEILRQHPKPIHAIFCAIGGGGLISGIGAYVKRLRPDIKVIGVEPVEADAMARSLAAGHGCASVALRRRRGGEAVGEEPSVCAGSGRRGDRRHRRHLRRGTF
jgi:threonine dehydratase